MNTETINSIDIKVDTNNLNTIKQNAIQTIVNATYGLIKPNQVEIVNIDLAFPNEPTIAFKVPNNYGDAIEQAFFDGRKTVIPADFK